MSLKNVPSPEGNEWKLDNDKLISVLMTRPPVPSGINELTCRCTTSNCKRNCNCKMNNLACTEACLCMEDDEGCCNPMSEYLFVTILVSLGLSDNNVCCKTVRTDIFLESKRFHSLK